MKIAGVILIIWTTVCVLEPVHSLDWTHYYLKAACKLMESRDLKNVRSKGHVHSTSKVVAFQAIVSTRLRGIASAAVVKFGQVLFNEGKGYNPSTGLFTAPVPGVYFFDWTITVDNGDTFSTEIVKNGNPFGYSYCGSRSQNFARPCTATGRIKLQRGDKVWIRTIGRGSDAHVKYTSFGGHKL